MDAHLGNHRIANTILYRIAWLHALQFEDDFSLAFGAYFLQFEHGCASDELDDIITTKDLSMRETHHDNNDP
jgi:hypothetical protein